MSNGFEAVGPSDRWPAENDWSDVVIEPDSIAERTWIATPAAGAVISDPNAAKPFVSGFQRGGDVYVREDIRTASGIEASRGFHFRCEDLT